MDTIYFKNVLGQDNKEDSAENGMHRMQISKADSFEEM
jgi:hypothetical protein